MKRPEVIISIVLIVGVLALCVGILLTSPPRSERMKKQSSGDAAMQGHDMSKMNSQPDQALGAIIDLTSQSEVSMDIKDFTYEKPNIKIKKGTKVTWTNRDAIQHNVMLEHEGSSKPHDPPTKSEVDPTQLAGPLLARGESYSFTFNEAGGDPYHCSPHPYMKGSVTVVE